MALKKLILRRYIYLADWGTREFQLALPATLLPAKTADLYCTGRAASVRDKAGKLILTFLSEEEAGDEWIDGLFSLPPHHDVQ